MELETQATFIVNTAHNLALVKALKTKRFVTLIKSHKMKTIIVIMEISHSIYKYNNTKNENLILPLMC